MTITLTDTASQLVYDRVSKRLTDNGIQCYIGQAPAPVEGTQSSYVVLLDPPAYMRPTGRYGQARTLSVVVNVYADCTRSFQPSNLSIAPQTKLIDDGASRALGTYELIAPLLDDQGRAEWPQVLRSEFVSADLLEVPDGGGSWLLTARYSLTVW